jgi:GLPGLI family protein
MKKSLFLLLFAFIISNAQNQRFIYEYSFIVDSTNTADLQKEMLVLDVNPTGSKFFSYEKFKSDSLMSIEIEKQRHSNSDIINFNPTYKGKIIYTISKNYPDFKTFLHIGMGTDEYEVLDDRKMVWKISSDKEKIGEFEAQEAEIEIFGRKWIAWFTTEIPIQDGPYKFSGLPGLIVKIEDNTKTHSFELKGISKNMDNQSLKDQNKLFSRKEIPITHSQYKKMFLELQNDPTKSLREMINRSGSSVKIFGPNGTEVKPSDILRQRELKAKEDRKKNNNPLELDLQK